MTIEEMWNCQKNESINLERDIFPFISQDLRNVVLKIDPRSLKTIEEIRLRASKPMMMQNADGDWFIETNGSLTRENGNLYITRQEEIIKTLELMSENSIYAYHDEIKNGFLTLKGGHRIGITGKIILDGSSVKNIKDISGLNIRISREVPGCSSKIAGYIIGSGGEIYNTLIISPPQCGKTTMVRDIARILSDGSSNPDFKGVKVGIVDERSEIAACFKGVAQNSVGVRTDVLDACPKSIGMAMMLRSMSPQVIVTDEIGNQGDRDAIMKVVNAGVKIITTAHGYSITGLQARREVLGLIEEKVFERYIVLSSSRGPGTIEEIVDGHTMKTIYKSIDNTKLV